MRARRLFALAAAAKILVMAPVLWFFFLSWVFPFPWESLQRPPAVIVSDRTGEPLRFFLPADERWRFPVKLSELPPELPRALVASEDRRFYHHFGVDPMAVFRAAWSNFRAGEVVSGASTIPMQIARMADPGPRTFVSKVRESFRALQLERRYSKDELLEIYLNLTPYGGNLEGIGTAAWFYFGKAPDQLSLGEIALLTALPRSPVRYDPVLHPEAARTARDRVLRQLAERGAFPRGEIENAMRQPVPRVRQKIPMAAPHFSEQVAALFPGAFSGQSRIRTTLDRRLQSVAEEQVANRIRELRNQGIGNAAVVVIENETRAVRALVGSAGFQETYFKGQVNGAVARRSPGSTLKPFLYALALDQGRIIPDSYLLDVPTDFSGYVAENYDDHYRGRVTVREALIQSLNACAVRLLSEAGLEDFHRLLKDGGLATLDRPASRYGLPLVLGAGEVTLLDLTNLYATLAEQGEYEDYRLLETPHPLSPSPIALPPRRERGNPAEADEPDRRDIASEASPLSRWPGGDGRGGQGVRGIRLVSPEAAALITEILTDVRRPDLPESWDLAVGVPSVAWKTGTSYGHRDAWAVGYSRRYTIGVWVGNFDGRPRKGISGSQHAGPLLFDLFRSIDPAGGAGNRPRPDEWTRRVHDLDRIALCAESHELPGPYCTLRIQAAYIPGRTRLHECTYHRRVLVDAKTGELLSGDCMKERPHELRMLTVFPAELVAWWRAQGSAVPEPPRMSAACRGIPAGEAPRIVSPAAATPYRIRRDTPAEYQRIPLIAQASAEASRLFWYQDGLLVATTGTGGPGDSHFLPSEPGEHRLVVTDDLGRSDGVTYRVE